MKVKAFQIPTLVCTLVVLSCRMVHFQVCVLSSRHCVKLQDVYYICWRSEALLRVQHVMDISLSKRWVKELVVALELSDEIFLAEALKWAEKCSKDKAVPF